MTKSLRDSESEDYLIPAGGRINIPATGFFVRCLESEADFLVSFNNGAKNFFASGMAKWTSMDESGLYEEFSSIQLFNESGDDISVTITYGYGEMEDNRLTASGNLNVQNAAGQKLNVDDTDTQALLTELIERLNDVGIADLTNCVGVQAVSSTVTVSAITNANGMILHHYSAVQNGSYGYHIKIGDDYLIRNNGSTYGLHTTGRSYRIPAGVAVEFYSEGEGAFVNAFYELLP